MQGKAYKNKILKSKIWEENMTSLIADFADLKVHV